MLIMSCTDEASKSLISKEIVETIANPYIISEDKAITEALAFTEKTNKSQQSKGVFKESLSTESVSPRSFDQASNRTASVKTKKYGVRIEEDSKNGREVRQEIPVYTINYKDENGKDAGYVVMVGDERILGNILIFSDDDCGMFDMEQRDDADFLEDMIAGYLYKNINAKEVNNPVTTRSSVTIMLDSIVVLGLNGDPYYSYSPFYYGPRCLTPPVATAMGEIMAWHKHPKIGTFPRYTTMNNPSSVVSVSYNLSSAERSILCTNNTMTILSNPVVSEYVSNLLAETGYRLDTQYGILASFANPIDAQSVFQEMGYLAGMVLSNYNFNTVKTDILNILPVYMYGTGSSFGMPFSIYPYVIYGVRNETNNGVVSDFLFLVDGLVNSIGFGNPLGSWFNEKTFSTNNDPLPIVLPAGTLYFTYRYNCKTITNIRPNPSKTGSTNPSWRVSNNNPY